MMDGSGGRFKWEKPRDGGGGNGACVGSAMGSSQEKEKQSRARDLSALSFATEAS